MAKIFNRVKFSVPDAPGTDTITVGTRSDNSFFLPTEQGAVDGDVVTYVIQKSNKDTEIGRGTIASGKTEVTRDTVLSSIVDGVVGTDKINIDGSAFMAFTDAAEDLMSLRTARTVTGTSDTITDGDGMGQVTYNSASAVAVSLAQAGTSLAFLKGWLCFVRNTGTGTATITPAGATINGDFNLALAEGDSAMIVSDGTNYTAIVWAAPVLGMSDVERQNAGLSNINLAKALVRPVRLINQLDIGFGTVSLADAGIDTDASSGYVNDNTDGLVKPTMTAGVDNAPTMTSNTVPSPYVISASHEDVSGLAGPAWKAFDGVLSGGSGWRDQTTANPWIKIDFGEATELGSYSIETRADSGGVFNEPTAWTVQGSDTGSFAGEETDIDSQSGISWSSAGQVKTFTLSQARTFRYYRWLVTAFNDTSLIITEIRTFAASTTDNMTLVTAAQTADSSVSHARVLITYSDTDSPTLNTDLTVEVTCDGGDNWTSATLTSAGIAEHQVAETADTECTAGTSFAARIKTLNGKDVSIYGVSLTVH